MERGLGHHAGGISDLLRLADEHGGALEYDLMTRAGATLADIPARVPWTALRSFVTHLRDGSALVAELHPELSAWGTAWGAAAIAADLFDLVAALRYEFALANTPKGRRRPAKPRPYPRPGAKDDVPRIGRDPIPIKDFDEWWDGDA